MTIEWPQPPMADLGRYLEQANAVILPSHLSETAAPHPLPTHTKLRVGVDLGTAYLVLVVLDEDGIPLAGEWQFAEVARDGLVVDYTAAVDLLRGMKERIEKRIGRPIEHAASGYPPGVPPVEVRSTAHVVEAAGMDCTVLMDEPTAANSVLLLRDGAIVDVGGGTTGIAVLQDGRVVYTADEPTGGRHFSLVVAGSLDISLEEAEALKTTRQEQPRLFPLVRPVMEKVGSIILRHTQDRNVPAIHMVGGGSAFMGMAEVIQETCGVPTRVVGDPLFVTPLGLALQDVPQ